MYTHAAHSPRGNSESVLQLVWSVVKQTATTQGIQKGVEDAVTAVPQTETVGL